MPFVAAPGAIKVVLNYTTSLGRIINTIWVYKAPPIGVSDLQTAASSVGSWCNTHILPRCHNSVSLTLISAYDMGVQNGAVYNTTAGLPIAGSQGFDCSAVNASLVISWRTANRGRSGRGRFYCPPCNEDNIETNGYRVGLGQQAAIAAAAGALAGIVQGSGLQHVIVSYFLNKLPRAVPLVQQVTSWVVDQAVDSQRRRLLGRGI
jgi:hypothetical protein